MGTPWIDRITAGYDDPREARVRMQARQPNNRLVRPEEIAAAAAYLASDEAVSVVGAVMVVDGGMTAGELQYSRQLVECWTSRYFRGGLVVREPEGLG